MCLLLAEQSVSALHHQMCLLLAEQSVAALHHQMCLLLAEQSVAALHHQMCLLLAEPQYTNTKTVSKMHTISHCSLYEQALVVKEDGLIDNLYETVQCKLLTLLMHDL
jgi:hypothetical protein